MTYLGEDLVLNEDNFVVEKLTNAASEDMNVNGSVTPVTFKAAPASGKVWVISRLLIYLEDSVAFNATGFGSIASPGLSTGVGIMCNNTQLVRWKSNLDIQLCMFDADGKALFAATDKSIAGRWTFAKHAPGKAAGLRIVDTTNGFAMVINDDLSGLDLFRARIEGYEINA